MHRSIPTATILFLSLFSLARAQTAAPTPDKPAPTTIPIPPNEPRIRLTPPIAPEPRINGAKIFGVRPGHPLLFTIAATGDRPMTFAADNLPQGLSLDPATGQFSGSIANEGQYTLTLRATNHLGAAHLPFKIICGQTLGLTPQMGWNDWYTWTSRNSDKIIRAAADAMAKNGMLNSGYQYVSIDDSWSMSTTSADRRRHGDARDSAGNINPNPYFPDMRALTDYVHSKGFKAGIYTSPGPYTCGHCTGSFGHEADDAKQFADWGFDLLKYDLCSYRREILKDPYTLQDMKLPYQKMGDLIKQQNRDIIFNMCQYGLNDVWTWGKSVGGNSWRTAGDIGGKGPGFAAKMYRDVFDKYVETEMYKYAGPGGWNDPDYLAIGRPTATRVLPMTANEQYTQMSLWSLIAAPLFHSGDVAKADDFVLGILCNAEVIDVDQDPLGKPGRRVAKQNDAEVWSRNLEDGTKAVGLFNRSETEQPVTATWSDLGISGPQPVRDLWRQKNLPDSDAKFTATVPRHGVVLLRIGHPDPQLSSIFEPASK